MEKAIEIWIFFSHKFHCGSQILSVIIRANPLDLQRKNKGRKKHLPLQELTRGER